MKYAAEQAYPTKYNDSGVNMYFLLGNLANR